MNRVTRVLIGIHTVFLFQAIFAMHASAEQDPVESIYGESQRKTTGIGYLIPSIEQLSRFKILFVCTNQNS